MIPQFYAAPGPDHGPRPCLVPERDARPLARARRLVAVLFARPDVPAAAEFFRAFGLEPTQVAADAAALRGRLSESPCVEIVRGAARFRGMRFEVAEREALDRLAQACGASVEPNDASVGGSRVVLEDPDGVRVEVVHGLRALPPLGESRARVTNGPTSVARVNTPVRVAAGQRPSVAKLGHTVLGARRLEPTLRWYQRHLGLIVSDFQLLDDDPLPVVAFLRCDLGGEPTDHHTLALGSAVDVGHLHTAFELEDAAEVLEAHAHLGARGLRHSWGIGRHELGSQIFDYWRDPEGDLFEHYADGDRFDASVPTGYHTFCAGSLHQWGPEPSADMVGRVPTLARGRSLLARLASDDDLTPARLARLLSAAS